MTDFPTLLCTLASEIPTLLYSITRSLKIGTPFRRSLPVYSQGEGNYSTLFLD